MIYLKRCAPLLATTTSGCASLRRSSIRPIFFASTPTSRLPKIGTNQKPPQWRDIRGSTGVAGSHSSLVYRLLPPLATAEATREANVEHALRVSAEARIRDLQVTVQALRDFLGEPPPRRSWWLLLASVFRRD